MITENKENKPLNKPMSGDIKKYKVYVKDPKTGNVKKVNFGDKNMEIKRDNPERKKSFRARHKCDTAKDKTTPRYWSCKFWSDKSVTDILNEIVEPDSIDVNKLSMKDELCPEIWKDEKLDPEVRKVLLKNAKEFIKFSKIDTLSFKDIVLTGSLANYNYTDTSDLDVHILMDFNQISGDKEFIGEYFRTKKNLWTEKFDTTVKGHDVELYVQDTSEPHVSSGVYSLVKNDWLSKPIKKMIAIDTANVQLKSANIMNNIDELVDNADSIDVINTVDKIMEKLKKMRASGLEKEGEFSNENLVFKILRNNGYLEKLSDIKKNAINVGLTMEGVQIYEGKLHEADFKNVINKAKKVGLLSLGMVVGLLATNISTQQLRDAGVPQEMLMKAEQFVKDAGQELGFRPQQDIINTNVNQNIAR